MKQPGVRDKKTQVLVKILNEKVVTEKDLLKIAKIAALNQIYKQIVEQGYPIRRRNLYSKNAKFRTANANHRVVIYYLE